VLGVNRDAVLERFLTQMPVRFTVSDAPAVLMAALIDLDPRSGRALAIQRLQEPESAREA
ncbi:MAG: YmdB family metallophosphoesterase, partial [Armatimonadetes bacterium]|nr:YmdB family metallophosphoesterase [Armatimonadota bacterium]